MLDYVVLYLSETGNTKQIAFQIFAAIPGRDKDILNLLETDRIPEARTYFIGFFVNKGTCSVEVIHCLEHLGDKNIALFATCGCAPSLEYQKKVEQQVSVWIESDNSYYGMFLCQGKMPIQVRHKYESMKGKEDPQRVERMLANFDEAMLHPDEKDLETARCFAKEIVQKIQEEN